MLKPFLISAALLVCFSAIAAEAKPPGTLEVKLGTQGNDIAFDKTVVESPFGKAVKILFINTASKESEILHNIAILKPGTFDEVIKELQKNGYDIEKMRKHPSVISMTKALAPMEQEILTFTPEKEGEYPYVCLMAGHADMLGMKGLLKVIK